MGKLLKYGTTIAFPAALIHRLTFERKDDEIWKLDKLILGVASLQYLAVASTSNTLVINRLRYLDWLVTTPMLLRKYWRLGQIHGWGKDFTPLAVSNTLMIIAGVLADLYPEQRDMYFFISFAFLIDVLRRLFELYYFLEEKGVKTFTLLAFFITLWPLYGLNFIVKDTQLQQDIYTILDFFAKIVFGYVFDQFL